MSNTSLAILQNDIESVLIEWAGIDLEITCLVKLHLSGQLATLGWIVPSLTQTSRITFPLQEWQAQVTRLIALGCQLTLFPEVVTELLARGLILFDDDVAFFVSCPTA